MEEVTIAVKVFCSSERGQPRCVKSESERSMKGHSPPALHVGLPTTGLSGWTGGMRRRGADACVRLARAALRPRGGDVGVAQGVDRKLAQVKTPLSGRCRMPRWEHAPRDPPRAGAISRIVSHLTGARGERSGGHGRCHSCVGTLGTRTSGPSSGVGLREFASSASTYAPDDDETDDMMVETLPVITAEDVKLQSTRDTADVLRIYKVVRAIRNRGHFAARLDPLGRSLGPLKEGYELMESTVPEDGADIAKLLNGFPNDLYLRGRKVNVGQYLGLHDPSPEKQFFLGNECKSLDPDGRAQWWTVEELMTRLRAVYCGTLSAEFNHLASVHKKDWLRRQLEGHVRDDGGVASTGTFIFISVRAIGMTSCFVNRWRDQSGPRAPRPTRGGATAHARGQAIGAQAARQGGPPRGFLGAQLSIRETVRSGRRRDAHTGFASHRRIRGGG